LLTHPLNLLETLYCLIEPILQFVPDLLAALFGLAFGSFLNVCITRLPKGESVVRPRSHCRNCAWTLPWYDNMPLLSWIKLHGRCRSCRTAIPWRYPLVEAALAALWVACLQHFGASEECVKAAILCFLLLGLAITDLEKLLLPDALTLPGLVAGLALSVLLAPGFPEADYWHSFVMSAVGAGLGAGILLVIAAAYWLARRKQGMGLGDVKLLAMIGAFLGPMQVLLVLIVGTVATSLAALVWLLLRKFPGKWMQKPMPYGTFLALAGIFALFFGEPIVKWYLGLGS
jgi:leader peptidase (prepilin peptidase)/N-methyltransferase